MGCKEIRQFLDPDRSADLLGILILILNLSLIAVGILVPFGALLNLDPIHVLACEVHKLPSPWWFSLGRFLLYLWSALEATRTFATILTPAMAIFNVAGNILRCIRQKRPLARAIKYYTQCQVLTETGRQGIREGAGLLMTAGFVIAVTCNYIVLSGFKQIPLIIYLCMIFLEIIVYLVLFQTLPLIITCFEISLETCTQIWVHRLNAMKRSLSKQDFDELRKKLKAQRPITYYYGTAIFERETKCNYYRNILEFTINSLLLHH